MLATTIFIGAAALLPGAPVANRVVAHDGAMSRRSALPLFGAGLALAALPTVVFADDDAVARIAARQNAAAQAERDANKPVVVREEGEGANLVGGAIFASVALSVPFFYKNIQRLGTKIASGGADDGRGGMKKDVRKKR